MQLLNQIFKWSFITAGAMATMALSAVLGVFASVEMLRFIVGISA